MELNVKLNFSAEPDKQPTIHGYVHGTIDIDTGKVQILDVPFQWDDAPYILDEVECWIGPSEQHKQKILECQEKLTKEEFILINDKLFKSYWQDGKLMRAVDSACKDIGNITKTVKI